MKLYITVLLNGGLVDDANIHPTQAKADERFADYTGSTYQKYINSYDLPDNFDHDAEGSTIIVVDLNPFSIVCAAIKQVWRNLWKPCPASSRYHS